MSVSFFTRFWHTCVALAIVIAVLLCGYSIEDHIQYPCERYKNVSYGSNERNVMDIYYPAQEDNSQNYGAILFLYETGWTGGDKEMCSGLAKKYAGKGYVTATVNLSYISEEVSIWDNMNEITEAISELQEHGAVHGYNITDLALHGTSAGAHIAMLYAWAMAEESPVNLSFVVNLSGATDFSNQTWNSETYGDNYGPQLACYLNGISELIQYENDEGALLIENIPGNVVEKIVADVSPITYLDENSIPVICGYASEGNDSILPYANQTILAERLEQCSLQYELLIFPESNHLLNNNQEDLNQIYEIVNEYCEKYFEIKKVNSSDAPLLTKDENSF